MKKKTDHRFMLRAVGFTGGVLLLVLATFAADRPREGEMLKAEALAVPEMYVQKRMAGEKDAPSDTLRRRGLTEEEVRATCFSCHEINEEGYVGEDPNHPLNQIPLRDRNVWEVELNLPIACGMCHTVVEPTSIPQRRWSDVIEHMQGIFEKREWPVTYEDDQWLDILHFYATGSKTFSDIPDDPPPSGLRFTVSGMGRIPPASIYPMVGNVNVVDLDQNNQPDVLATDFLLGSLVWIHRVDTAWVEETLAYTPTPAKAETCDYNGDGHLDILLACIGNASPTDDLVGSVLLLTNDGSLKFRADTILTDVGRLADARPVDFDNDGDMDVVVAVFGFLTVGEIGWLEQDDEGRFEYHSIIKKAGGIHVIPTNLNDDDRMDFIGLIAQEHEEIIGFVNKGDGKFEQHLIYKAFTPAFGFSGIELVDLDEDGDLDIIATNGDAIDLPGVMVLPYHGIQWLENKGNLEYEPHPLLSYYGAYRAVPGDMDGDGDLDILAVSLFNQWVNPTRMSAIWLENDGALNFTPHGIGVEVSSLISVDIGDMDMDGDLDFVTAGMHVMKDPHKRIGRINLWTNEGPME
ncbi:MAG: VCBS repeat-containing protein [Ignavibacteriae bacterium]|nr:VCBS repeat-containing protein [Ignavibacteriota bacterium]MCB9215530.1 VCBS repeat-containing protein [Ignavibacteria bacterium]